MRKLLSVLALFSHSLLQADEIGTVLMSATLFVLLFTLIIALMLYLKNIQRENLRFNTLFFHSDTPILFINSKGIIQELNRSAETLMGYSKAQLTHQKWFEKLLPDETSLQIRHQIHRTLNKEEKIRFTAPVIRADGTVLEAGFTLEHLPKPLKGFILTLEDRTKGEALKEELITVHEHLNETQRALEQLTEQFKVTFDIAINGIALLDDDGTMIYLNKALTDMFEYNEAYIKHLGLTFLVDNEESCQQLLKVTRQGEPIEKMLIRSQTRNGQKLDIHLTMGYLPELKQYYLVLQDITQDLAFTTQMQERQKDLTQRVQTDSLTSAYNRSYMQEFLAQLMESPSEPFGFLLFDIDHFKNINDTYGHLVGDDVLVHLVNALKTRIRKDDLLARFGGEEFVIVLPHTPHEESLDFAKRLQAFIQTLSFEGCPQITCSFGVTSFQPNDDRRALIQRADNALYLAKEAGRNCVIDADTEYST